MKKALKIILPLVMAIAILVSIGWYLFVYDRDFTLDVLLGQARYHNDNGNPEIASWFYDLAYNYSSRDENIAIELANQYKAAGNYTKAEYTLTNAIADGGTEELYIALCQTFVEQDKLLDAVNMLDNIANPTIKQSLDAQRPHTPVPSLEPGFYSELKPLILSSSATVYFTTDGNYPSTQNAPYKSPINLTEGTTVINLIAVGKNSLVSPLCTLEYTIAGIVEEVRFADPAFEAAVRKTLNVPDNSTLMTNDLWDISEFIVPEDAASVEDLHYLPNLEKLTMHGQTLPTLEVLAPLEKLRIVDLTGCRFPAESLRILSQLPQIARITLADCGLSTIAELSGTKGLTHLNLSTNMLGDLKPLSTMPSLAEVILDNNAVRDLSPVGGLKYLQKLDISFNAVTDLTPLEACTDLTWLNAGNNTIADVTSIGKLTELTYLHLDSNELAQISPLGQCTRLEDLDISRNQIGDISALSSLNSLKIFDFAYNQVTELPQWSADSPLQTIDGSHNQVKSLKPLADKMKLNYVFMDYNKLTSVDELAKCYLLVQVNVYGNEIKSVTALTDQKIVVNFDPT